MHRTYNIIFLSTWIICLNFTLRLLSQFKYLTIINSVYNHFHKNTNVQWSLCAKRLCGQWPHWYLALIKDTRWITLITYLWDVWLISLSSMIFKVSFSFNGPCFHWTHMFYFLSWNIKLKMDISHVMWISLFLCPG